METKNKIIITALLLIAVIGVGAFVFLSGQSQATQINNTLTQQGTKLNIQNNNNQYWSHGDMVIENVTFKNGTVGNLYIEYWIKPGENLTIDLSNALGYGNEPLPTGTVIRTLNWMGLFNPNGGGGNSNFAQSLKGWSNTPDPANPPVYQVNMGSVPVGPLPSGVTGNLVIMDTTIEGIDATINSQYPHTATYETLFTEIIMTVDPSGNLVMTFAIPPTLCSTIAHIIS